MMHERMVLVEGGDEVCVFPRVMDSMQAGGGTIICEEDLFGYDSTVFTDGYHTIRFSPVGGKSGFANAVRLLPKLAERGGIRLHSLGLVCDSDDDPAKSLNLLQKALEDAGLPVPEAHADFAGQDLTVGIFVLPSDSSCGSLDTLCRMSVADDTRTCCVDDYLDCLGELGKPVKDCDKSFVFAYSVAVGKKGERAGALAKHGELNLNHEVFKPLDEFLKKLLLC